MEKFTIANGVAFRYLDTEKGDNTILLIHGYLESIESWETIIPLLSPKYRVIAVDLPGHGISEVKGDVHTMEFLATTIHSLLDKLGISKVNVIGHSMGGYVGFAIARYFPSILNKLILLHSTPDGDTPERKANREREIEVILGGRKEMLATINPGKGFASANKKKFDEAIRCLSEQVMMTEDEGIIAILRGLMTRGDNSDIASSLEDRLMFIFGHDDTFMPIDYCRALEEKFPKANTVYMESSGHNSHLEEEEKFIKTVTNYL